MSTATIRAAFASAVSKREKRNSETRRDVDVWEEVEVASARGSPGSDREASASLDMVLSTTHRESRVMLRKINKMRTTTTLRLESEVYNQDPRRRTIFIPDDTTVLTIHPGAKQPKFGNGHNALRNSTYKSNIKHSFVAHPKRSPLMASECIPQTFMDFDKPGLPSGKENIPPARRFTSSREVCKLTTRPQILKSQPRSLDNQASVEPRNGEKVSRSRPTKAEKSSSGKGSRLERRRIPSSLTSQTNVKVIARNSICKRYPPIGENIHEIQMFDDSWLQSQEVTIVELLNRLLNNSSVTTHVYDSDSIRHQMLELYQDTSMVLLHKRLQASLQFGALALARDGEGENVADRFMVDVGLRDRFLKMWMRSYQIRVLRPALELVVGRRILPGDRETEELAVERFIEVCLLHNEDTSSLQSLVTAERVSRSWRQTMLRGLLIIILLDKAKAQDVIPGNLFRKNSKFKSSAAILAELNSILRSSRVDISRHLAYLDYRLSHVQALLSEYDYSVRNSAVDFRDGVKLARVAELVLLAARSEDKQNSSVPSSDRCFNHQKKGTVQKNSLLQQLKYPSLGRVIRIANVQIALEALNQDPAIAATSKEITAADIVDGHREKTISLLWSIVSRFSIRHMIDWVDLHGELVRLRFETSEEVVKPQVPDPDLEDVCDVTRSVRLWARFIAKKHGRLVGNFSTDFSDGILFGLIVDEYLKFLRFGTPQKPVLRLEDKLSELGCSLTFASIFGHAETHGQFFNADFVTTVLAFLCSRLLWATKILREKRRVMKNLATDCKLVFEARRRVIDAAIVIQRSWRGYWSWKAGKLESEADIWLL